MILTCERFKVYVYLKGNIMEMVNLVLEKKKSCGNIVEMVKDSNVLEYWRTATRDLYLMIPIINESLDYLNSFKLEELWRLFYSLVHFMLLIWCSNGRTMVSS